MSSLKDFNSLMRMDYTQKYLRDVLGEKAQSFVTSLTDIVSNDKMLQACDPNTIMFAGITAASMDLPINKNLGYAYVIPYNDRRAGTSVAQFQMGYKGFVQLAQRSGQFKCMNATDVREGELKGFNRLTGGVNFEWDETPERSGKKVIGYAAYFSLNNGFSKTLYMSIDEIESHAKRYSQTYRNERARASSKWTTDFDAMAKKTVLKLLLSKWAPLSLDMEKAIQADQSVQREAGSYSYVDNDKEAAIAEIAERAKERALAEDAEYSDEAAEHTEDAEPQPAQPIDPNVNDLPFED